MQVACGVPAAITIDAAGGLRLAFARSESREFDAPPPECPQPARLVNGCRMDNRRRRNSARIVGGMDRQAHVRECDRCQRTRCSSVAFFGIGCEACQRALIMEAILRCY
jgi:hypothetical protein